jgi:hypothetical protein
LVRAGKLHELLAERRRIRTFAGRQWYRDRLSGEFELDASDAWHVGQRQYELADCEQLIFGR